MRENGEREVKRGKILAEIFWGKWEMVFEWATVISNSKLNWLDNTREWVPQSSKIYLSAIELCNSEIENNILLFPVFIILTQLKLSLSDENKERKSSQTLKIVWVPRNSQTSSYDSKQPNPNRASISFFWELSYGNWVRKLIQTKQLAVGPTNFRNWVMKTKYWMMKTLKPNNPLKFWLHWYIQESRPFNGS